MSQQVIINGAFHSSHELSISPLNRGMMYGDGCFETFRYYKGKFLHFNDHLNRLREGLNYLGFQPEVDFETLQPPIILELAERNKCAQNDAIVRIQCWRAGGRGYGRLSTQGNWLVEVLPMFELPGAVSLKTVQTRAIPEAALSKKAKFSNGINYIKAAQEAVAAGYDEALMLTTNHLVCETTTANIFWVKGHTVYTPSLNCDLLPGITRKIVIHLLKTSSSLELKEGDFFEQELYDAEAIFLTNALREIHPVSLFNKVQVNPEHEAIRVITEMFDNYKQHTLL